MKKYILILILFPIFAHSQNLQLYYESAKERQFIRSRIEMFKPDDFGASYFFVDMEYDQPGEKGVSAAYWEINRYINLSILDNLAATVQYNDGVASYGRMGPIWLFGLSYPILKSGNISIDLLYRSAFNSNKKDAQVTLSWNTNLVSDRLSFSGYTDIWTEDKTFESSKRVVFLMEDQIWYNINKYLSLGMNIEVSKNLYLEEKNIKFYLRFGAKWNF